MNEQLAWLQVYCANLQQGNDHPTAIENANEVIKIMATLNK